MKLKPTEDQTASDKSSINLSVNWLLFNNYYLLLKIKKELLIDILNVLDIVKKLTETLQGKEQGG